MPSQFRDPFQDRTVRLDPSVNPYVQAMAEGQKSGSLPVHFGPALRDMPGTWRESFPNPENPFVIEIGCHLGKTIIELAELYPETNFLGIDITYKRVVTAAQRAQARNLTNVRTALIDARWISDVFAKNELDGAIIFFPDPWVKKKRQAKNRLLNDTFAHDLQGCIREQGFLWFKTDQQGYFEDASQCFIKAGLRPSDDAPYQNVSESTFERRFRLKGLNSYGQTFTKPPIFCH